MYFVGRSPVYSYLSASLQGLHTIRAFHKEDKCQEEFGHHQNLHSEAWFLHLTTNRWLAVRLDCLVGLFVTAVAFGAMLSAGSKLVTASSAVCAVFPCIHRHYTTCNISGPNNGMAASVWDF